MGVGVGVGVGVPVGVTVGDGVSVGTAVGDDAGVGGGVGVETVARASIKTPKRPSSNGIPFASVERDGIFSSADGPARGQPMLECTAKRDTWQIVEHGDCSKFGDVFGSPH